MPEQTQFAHAIGHRAGYVVMNFDIAHVCEVDEYRSPLFQHFQKFFRIKVGRKVHERVELPFPQKSANGVRVLFKIENGHHKPVRGYVFADVLHYFHMIRVGELVDDDAYMIRKSERQTSRRVIGEIIELLRRGADSFGFFFRYGEPV